jgi:TonB family protein
MPTSEAPANVNEPEEPVETSQENGGVERKTSALATTSAEADSSVPAGRGSRWVDYDTHELLQMISDLEDERRWSRLREGIWLAVLFHLLLLLALTVLPKYVFRQPPIINPSNSLKHHNFVMLNPPALHAPALQPKPKPLPPINKKTLEALNHPPILAPVKPPPPPPQPLKKVPEVLKPKLAQPVLPRPKPQPAAPHPAPARPNFAMNMESPAQQLQQAMRNAMRNRNAGRNDNPLPGGLAMHPGASSGGVQILSNTHGVDFNYWLRAWYYDTEQTWDPLIPDEVNPPISKAGEVLIRFKVLPDGRVMPGSMRLVGSSGDTALDRAAWGAITGSSYPPLPSAFHGPYIELQALFLYNMRPPQ